MASARWVAWHRLGSIDRVGLTGLSCSSVGLCVAIDNSGSVLRSSTPFAVGATWQVADVDSDKALFAISCPSASLCVAVDRAGNVITSTDPLGGPSAWQVTNLGRGRPLSAVSCASPSLCVAGDTTALVSTVRGHVVNLQRFADGHFVSVGASAMSHVQRCGRLWRVERPGRWPGSMDDHRRDRWRVDQRLVRVEPVVRWRLPLGRRRGRRQLPEQRGI